jgi:hypothetical protein
MACLIASTTHQDKQWSIFALYSQRQKYGINSLKIKQNFFQKKSLDRSILVYKNIQGGPNRYNLPKKIGVIRRI